MLCSPIVNIGMIKGIVLYSIMKWSYMYSEVHHSWSVWFAELLFSYLYSWMSMYAFDTSPNLGI